MTEAVIIYRWAGFYMITASVMKELNKLVNDRNIRKGHSQIYIIPTGDTFQILFPDST